MLLSSQLTMLDNYRLCGGVA